MDNNEPPPQPETIMIEAAARNSIRTTSNFDEWESAVVPTPIYAGDEISVNMSFLDAKGTGTEILEFSSGGDSQNNKQKILFETYLVDCGTNDINKGKDWTNFSNVRDANLLPGDNKTSNPVMENGKTYKPTLAVRWDRLLHRTSQFTGGNGFYHNIGDTGDKQLTSLSTSNNPMIVADYCINFRPDAFCANLFNSFNAYQEISQYMTQIPPTKPNYTRVATKEAINDTKREVNADASIYLNKFSVNIDALPYWEIRRNAQNIEIAVTENVFSAIPNGTAINIFTEWTHKLASILDANNQDVPFVTYLASVGFNDYLIENYRSQKTNGLTGNFVVSEYIIPEDGKWENDFNFQIWNNDPLDTQSNFTGQKAYILRIKELVVDEITKADFTNFNTPLSYGNPDATTLLIDDSTRGGDTNTSWTSTNGGIYVNAFKTSRGFVRNEQLNGRVATDNLAPIDMVIPSDPVTAPPLEASRASQMPFDIFISYSPFGVRSVDNLETEQLLPFRLYPRCRNTTQDAYFGSADCSLAQMTYNGSHTAQMNSLWTALYNQNGLLEQNGAQQASGANPLACWKQARPYQQYATSPFQLAGYDTYNNYVPFSCPITAELTSTADRVRINHASLLGTQRDQIGVILPDGVIAVINEGTIHEEIVATLTTRMVRVDGVYQYTEVGLRARNISINPNLTDNVAYNPVNPAQLNTFSKNPVAWQSDNKFTHPVGTTIKFYCPREGMNMKVVLNGQNVLDNYEYGVPITNFTPYRGDAPLTDAQNQIPNLELMPNETLDTYSQGAVYALYARSQNSVQSASPPDSKVNKNNFTQSVSSPMGFRFFPLISKKEQVVNTPRDMAMKAQISSASGSNRFSNGSGFSLQRPRTSFNPHAVIGMLYYSSFEETLQVGELNTEGEPNTNLKLFNSNYYGWSPDRFEMYDTTQATNNSTSTLKTFSSETIDHICGYVPLMKEFTFETPKPYLTPTDLSNYFTEEIHKTTNVFSMYDGTELPNTRNRGMLQNETLFPIYGSWGANNYPVNGGLNRDYYTFTQSGGYAIGSVIGLDGNTMPTDWKDKMGNSVIDYSNQAGTKVPNINYSYLTTNANYPTDPSELPITYHEDTFGLYPRNNNNLIHLWNFDTVPNPNNSLVPSFNSTPSNVFDVSNPSLFILSVAPPTFTWEDYPVAPSALQTNSQLSADINASAVPQVPTNIDNSGGLTSNLAVNLAGRQDPNYGGAVNTKYTLVATGADVDPPNTGTEFGAREDNTYRLTNDYPVNFLNSHYHKRYLSIGQYIGTDNFVLSYNANVSAFEYQFLHQPFNTTFNINNGVAEGGQNAIRIFDQVPANVENWERFSGVNVINWTTPLTPKNAFTPQQVLIHQPNYSLLTYPNGINPISSADSVGKAYMNKLGFKDVQITPVIGTALGYENNVVGLGVDTLEPDRFVYEPRGTTGADTDIADAIIQTSFSAEDNPNITAHSGKGNLIYYPAGVDTGNLTIKNKSNADSSIVYDFSYSRYAQRGGLKSHNHGKAMGLPNSAGTPQVRDDREVPRQLNTDGEQRSGYTIEIGSSPIRALDLPIKLTDGYYYILCDDIVNDAQFYISNKNGMVIPAVSIVSKTYVSGDFYTTFQSPISWYAKKDYVISRLRISIRTSSMEIPTNLGGNSSVIFSIRRFNPPKPAPPLTTSEQQNNAYAIMEKEERQNKPKKVSFAIQTKQDIMNLADEILAPNADAGLIQQFGQQIDIDALRGNPQEFMRQNPEIASVLQNARALSLSEQLIEEGIDPNTAQRGEAQSQLTASLSALGISENPSRSDVVLAALEADRIRGTIALTERAVRLQDRQEASLERKGTASSGYATGSAPVSTPYASSLDTFSVNSSQSVNHALVEAGVRRPSNLRQPQVQNPHYNAEAPSRASVQPPLPPRKDDEGSKIPKPK